MPATGFLLGLAIVTAFNPPANSADAPADGSDVLSVHRDAAERMTVPVTIGTAGTYRFLVDTGAQNTVISNELATRLALAHTARARLIGTAGESLVDIVRLDGLTLGTRSFDGLFAPLLRQQDIGADGVVGLDSLQRQRVMLDFRRNLMTIDDADSVRDTGFDIVVRARRRSGQLIMTDATIDGVRVDVVIDTGSNGTIGNLALATALQRHGKLTETTLQSITGQTIAANIGVARELVIGPMRLSEVSIAYAAAPPFAYLGLSRRPAIFLGMAELRAFRRVAIDFASRKVKFDLAPRLPDLTGSR